MKNKSLHITFLDFDDIRNPLLAAGQAVATDGVGKILSQKGHHISVICSKFPGFQNRTENGIEYRHIGLGSKNIKLNNLIYILSLPFVVPFLHADIIVECFTAPISTLFSPVFTKIPVVVLPSMFNAKEFSKKYHIPFTWVESFGIQFYKYFMPYSDIDKSKIERMNKHAICRIVGQGIDKDYFKVKAKNPEHILFLGRFDIPQKGIDLLLDAYSQVINKISFPLILAGHGPDEVKIRKIIQRLGIEKKVKIVGPAYGKRKFDLISKAIFVAFPSRHDELSLWELEALAGGMPLVTFNIPEEKWVPNSVSLKAKPFNVQEYGKLLLQATNKRQNAIMRRNTRLFAKKYTWENVASNFEDFFYDVLQKESKSE